MYTSLPSSSTSDRQHLMGRSLNCSHVETKSNNVAATCCSLVAMFLIVASFLCSESMSLEVENESNQNEFSTGQTSFIINTSGRRVPASKYQALVPISSFQFQLSLLQQVVSHVDEVPLHRCWKLRDHVLARCTLGITWFKLLEGR